MTKQTWTKERIKTAIKMWTTKRSAQEIANVFGITRNAVIGKLHRMGYFKRLGPQQNTTPKSIKKAQDTELLDRLAAEPSEGIPFADLDAGQCRYPQGALWCGKACRGSWCDAHRAIVYRPTKMLTDQPERQGYDPVDEMSKVIGI